ncbi:unnamed protein product [Brassica oleracea]
MINPGFLVGRSNFSGFTSLSLLCLYLLRKLCRRFIRPSETEKIFNDIAEFYVFTAAERLQQKLILQDTSLKQQIKEQIDVKDSLDGAVKSILEKLSKDPNQEKLKGKSATRSPKRLSFVSTCRAHDLALKMPEPVIATQVRTSPQVKYLSFSTNYLFWRNKGTEDKIDLYKSSNRDMNKDREIISSCNITEKRAGNTDQL